MKKTQTKVVVTTVGGFTATADDAVAAGQGNAAWTSLENKRDVMIATDDETILIPYHAIVDHAVMTKTTEEVEDPVDETCKEAP